MTFILNNITNWLSESQSSDSVLGSSTPDATDFERYEVWDSASGNSSVKTKDERKIASTDGADLYADDTDDLPGISQVVNSAIEWGGYLLNYGKETGKQVTRTAVRHIKSALQENVNAEEVKLSKTDVDVAIAPWVGCVDEESMKSQILSISEEKRNFLRGPPVGVQFQFDYAVNHPVAMVMLDVDPNLKALRFELVPKQVKEESFWRNYFYHVALVKQSAQLTSKTKNRACSGEDVSSNSDLVFVSDTFPACDVTDKLAKNAGEPEWEDGVAPKDDVDDFELVEMADCDCHT